MLFYLHAGDAGFWLIALILVGVGGFILLFSVFAGSEWSKSNDEQVNPLTSALKGEQEIKNKQVISDSN